MLNIYGGCMKDETCFIVLSLAFCRESQNENIASKSKINSIWQHTA